MTTNLFCYGTLCPGEPRWPILQQWVDGEPIPDSIQGQLFDTRLGWPAAVIEEGAATIPGYTVPIQEPLAPVALAELDLIEGTPHLFRRNQTRTVSGRPVWVYHWHRDTEGMTKIDRWIP